MLPRIILLFFLACPSEVLADQIDCSEGGGTTLEIVFCKQRILNQLEDQLRATLSGNEIKDLNQASKRLCSVAFENFKQGSIYPIAVKSCIARIMSVALDEIEGGMKGTGKCF